jgi:phage terminase large subunit-like protein
MAIGAIWNRQMFTEWRRSLDTVPAMGRTVVGIDPAVSNEIDSDEHGIVVAGMGEDRRGYILEDASLKGAPRQWAERAVSMFDKWEADAIVIERNQGGDMCREVLRTVRPQVPVIEVTSTKGKHLRAEPIASLYALGKVSHVGTFPKLEDQMCLFTAAGYDGNGSPDHVDAAVHALTELFPALTKRVEKRPKASQQPASSWMG